MKKTVIILTIIIQSQLLFGQTGEWTWMHGDSVPNQPGLYGVKGTPGPNNRPAAAYEASEWVDNLGNLWLFGGGEVGNANRYNTLWRYMPATNEWTWMHGDSIPNQRSIYGTMGLPSPTNQPGSRGFGVPTWVDSSGNLWLYGGFGKDSTSFIGLLNDLWKYDVSTNEWTWIHGSPLINTNAVYGVKGIPNPANTPGQREETSATWVDSFDNLWLFGGKPASIGVINDLWKYNISSNEWTWVTGDSIINQNGIYGVKGTPDVLNKPGARYAYSSWIDSNDNLWLFGGQGYPANGGNSWLNDLWKFNTATNEWTWMNGSDTVKQLSTYASPCLESPITQPGGINESRSSWKDAGGNFWMFGGFGYTDSLVGTLNQLLRYNPSSNQWMQVSGSSVTQLWSVYGIKTVSSPANVIGGRMGATGWVDPSGTFWVWGGQKDGTAFLNDLWRYVPDPNCGGFVISAAEKQPNRNIEIIPNPFSGSTTVILNLQETRAIKIEVTDILGKRAQALVEDTYHKGRHEIEIETSSLGSGVYMLTVWLDNNALTKKIIKTKE